MNNYEKLLQKNWESAREIAKEKGLKTLPNSFVAEKTIEIPNEGIEFQSAYGLITEKPIIDTNDIFAKGKEYIGCYNSDSGMIAYVNENMETFLAGSTKSNIKVLKEAGYQENKNMAVPYSAVTTATNEYIQKRLDKIKKEAKNQENLELYEKKLSYAREIAKGKGLESLPQEFKETLSLEIPNKGIEVITPFGEDKEYPLIKEDDLTIKEDFIGGYNINNGKIVYVDENMKTRITYYTEDAENILIKEGYTKNQNMPVPFSNMEEPKDQYLKQRMSNIKNNSSNIKTVISENSSKQR